MGNDELLRAVAEAVKEMAKELWCRAEDREVLGSRDLDVIIERCKREHESALPTADDVYGILSCACSWSDECGGVRVLRQGCTVHDKPAPTEPPDASAATSEVTAARSLAEWTVAREKVRGVS